MIKRNLLIKIQLMVLLIVLLSFLISDITLPSSGDMACCDATWVPNCKVECCAAIGWSFSSCFAVECEYCECYSFYYDPDWNEFFDDWMEFECGTVWYI